MTRGIKNTRKPKRLSGRSHAKPVEQVLVLPTLDDLSVPSNLSGAAASRWSALAPVLRDAGLLTAANLSVFILHCRAWGDLLEAQAHLDREGKVVPGARGGTVRNPWSILEKSASETFFKTGKMFGLSPDSVGKVKGVPPTEPSLDDTLRGMAGGAKDETAK